MVNGVPASGKSAVARRLSAATGWPVFALDTVKDPFLAEIGDGRPAVQPRARARELPRDLRADRRGRRAGTTAIVDAWFGFQPRELLEELLADGRDHARSSRSGATRRPTLVAARYRDRAGDRLPGHPGPEYADELRALAARAEPMRLGPVLPIDTRGPVDAAAAVAFVRSHWT